MERLTAFKSSIDTIAQDNVVVLMESVNLESSSCDGYVAPVDFPILEGLRVLVVDDDADTRALYNFILTERGTTVTEAASSQAALAAMQAESFDLLISDIGLPDVDGFKLLRQIRALPVESNAQIPAMAITGFADENTRLQILAAGFQRSLVKPTDLEQFVAIVAELAEQHQRAV